jgi:hypothetical protein
MDELNLGGVLNGGAKILAELEDLQPLTETVGSQPYVLERELKFGPGDVPVFRGQTLKLTADTSGSLQIRASDFAEQAFGDDASRFTAPAGHSFTELALNGQLDVEGQASASPNGTLTLSLGLKSGASFQYRHLLPVRADRPRLEAFKNVIARSCLPQLAPFDKLDPGEVHELIAAFYMDLGLKASAGGDASFVGDLFRDLPSQIQIHVQYVAEASLNIAFYDQLKISVGRALLLDDQRVRLRAEREDRRKLSLGARFALQVQYDLTAGLEALLEEALNLLPVRRAIEILTKIRDTAQEVANGDWNQIKQKLQAKAGDEVTELLGDAGWLNWVDGSPEVQKLLALSNDAVEAYAKLDERLKSLWASLLGRADVGAGSKLRTLLEKLKALDPENPDQLLLNEESRKLIEAVEILSGQSLEEILLATGVSSALQDVRDLAAKALAFLDSGPEFLEQLNSFAERTGISKAVAWLKANATTTAQLKATAEAQVRKLVEQLAGKALAQITDDDFQRIKAWADRIAQVLSAPADIEAKLKSRIDRVKGEVGLSIALEIERVSRTTALLDLEFDPTDAGTRRALEKIGDRDLGSALRDLPAGADKPQATETFAYQLRECVFTSERTRTSAVNVFMSWLGWSKGSRRLVEESEVRVSQSGATFTREALYSGGAIQSAEEHGAVLTSGVWLTSRATGTGKDTTSPYSTLKPRELRLTFSMDDGKTVPDDLDALGVLLSNLGFDALPPHHPRNLVLPGGTSAAVATRFSIDIYLPDQAVESFFSGFDSTEDWLLDELNAIYRWLTEKLMSDRIWKSQPQGVVMARSLFAKPIRQAWLKGRLDLSMEASKDLVSIMIDGHTIDVTLARKVNDFYDWTPLWALPFSRDYAGNAFMPLRAVGQQLAAADKKPADLVALSRQAGEALLAGQVHPIYWPNPMLGVWMVISRLSRRDPAALKGARGLATLRWKDAAGDWSPTNLNIWKLDNGVLPHDRTNGTGMFPIVK